MKNILKLVLLTFIINGCSKEDIEEKYVGNKYANLLFATLEECESAQELYFENCSQTLEILNNSKVQIMLTDMIYETSFFIQDKKLIVKSSSDTYEFSQDITFTILENGDLKLNGNNWIKYEDDFYE